MKDLEIKTMFGTANEYKPTLSERIGMDMNDFIMFFVNKYTKRYKCTHNQYRFIRNILYKSDMAYHLVDLQQKLGYISSDGEPLRCTKCGSFEFVDTNIDHLNGIEIEKERYCKDCSSLQGWWADGYWVY